MPDSSFINDTKGTDTKRNDFIAIFYVWHRRTANGLYGQNAGMGGVAYGMRNNVLMNIENPAGLTALDSKRLLTELAILPKMNRALLKAALIGRLLEVFLL